MKNYIDPTNRISIAGTDCMPKAAAMTDGRLGRLFDALNMLECVFGERHLDDEVTEVMHAYFDMLGEQSNPRFAKVAFVED